MSLKYLLLKKGKYKFLLSLIARKTRIYFTLLTGIRFNKSQNKNFDTDERKEIKKYVEELEFTGIDTKVFESLPQITLSNFENNSGTSEIKIRLASQEVYLSGSLFKRSFKDIEDFYSVHRFTWLYQILLYYPNIESISYCLTLITDWIELNKEIKKSSKYDSYSISERISMWLIFLIFIKKYVEPSEQTLKIISDSISRQVHHLSSHLEFRGNKTNNHILNNAKALYMTGSLLRMHQIEELGKRIFRLEYNSIFNNDIYQEGSTHYLLLLTKNILEMQLVATLCEDRKFTSELEPITNHLLFECTNLFENRNYEFPLIGDISPDLHPDWFKGFPFSLRSSKVSRWMSLFGDDVKIDSATEIDQLHTDDERNTKIIHLANDSFELWVNTRNGKIPCHGHNDNGCFVLFYENRPFITDPGLCNYVQSDPSISQKGPAAHNMPIVNNFAPDIDRDSVYSDSGLFSKCDVILQTDSTVHYKVTYFNDRVILDRKVVIKNHEFTLIDTLISSTKNDSNIVTNFHFDSDISKLDNKLFKSSNLLIAFSSNCDSQIKMDSGFKKSVAYGERKSLSSLVLHTQLQVNKPIVMKISKMDSI